MFFVILKVMLVKDYSFPHLALLLLLDMLTLTGPVVLLHVDPPLVFTMLGSSLISWKTKKQPTISRSSTEVEYRSLAALTSELQWLKYLLSYLGFNHSQSIVVHCDSKAAIHIVENPIFHERTKHNEINYHFVCEKFKEDSLLLPTYVLMTNWQTILPNHLEVMLIVDYYASWVFLTF